MRLHIRFWFTGSNTSGGGPSLYIDFSNLVILLSKISLSQKLLFLLLDVLELPCALLNFQIKCRFLVLFISIFLNRFVIRTVVFELDFIIENFDIVSVLTLPPVDREIVFEFCRRLVLIPLRNGIDTQAGIGVARLDQYGRSINRTRLEVLRVDIFLKGIWHKSAVPSKDHWVLKIRLIIVHFYRLKLYLSSRPIIFKSMLTFFVVHFKF